MKLSLAKTHLTTAIILTFCGLLCFNTYSRPVTHSKRLPDGAPASPLTAFIGFLEQPTNQTACEGYTATFSAIFDGPTTFKWQQSTDEAFSSPVDLSNDAVYQISSTSNTSTLQVLSSISLTGMYYRCIADPEDTPISSETATLTITQLATISYGSSPLVFSSTPTSVTLNGPSGGTFSASPAGLTIDPSTGEINTSTSTRGTYLITYTVAAPAACPSYVVPNVAVQLLQTATRTFTWTGAINDDWHNLGNWLENSTIPVILPSGGSQYGDDVIIPVVGNDRYPKVGSTAHARSITIAAGAQLNVTTDGNLTVMAAGADGVTNNGKFTNEGIVLIDSSYNDGFVNKPGASLLNKKTLTISKGTGNPLKNSSWVENFSSSTLTINAGLETGVVNYNNSTIKNQGTFTINGGNKGALYNEGTVNNLYSFTTKGGASGTTVVNLDTLSNQADATFAFNNGASTALDNANYLYNAGTFSNSSGTGNDDAHPAVINRENATFLNTSTANTSFTASGYSALVFQNDGYLESSSPLTIRNSGKGLLLNNVKGVIVNNAELKLGSCSADAFTNFGKFANNATGALEISGNGGYEIVNNGIFTSATGCTLALGSGSKGIKNNNNGNFSNKCATTTYGAIGSSRIENLGTYIHDAGSFVLGGGGVLRIFDNADTMQIDVPIAINQSIGELIFNSGIFTIGSNTVVTVLPTRNTSLMITNTSTGAFHSDGTFINTNCSGIIDNQGTMTLGAGSKLIGTKMNYLINNSGNLTNEGMLSFRKGNSVVNNSGVFSNKGSLYSSNTTNGIHNYENALIENSGFMNIDSVYNHGIYQENGSGNSFTNTGKISINYTLGNGILNSEGSFTNNGLLRIGDYALISHDAIQNAGTLTNGEGGKIYLNGAEGSGIINEGGTVTNLECAAIESFLPIVNSSGTFSNAGLIRKLADTRTAASNIGTNTGTIVNDDTDAFIYSGSNGPLPPVIAITSGNEILFTGETRTLTATPAGGVFDVMGPATVDGSTLTATGTGMIVVSYTIVGSDNCKYSASQIIEPLRISKITSRPPGCNDVTGSITITTSGIGTFEYSIDGLNWQNTPTFTGLSAGTYTISTRVMDTPAYLDSYPGNPVVITAYQPITSVAVPEGNITLNYTCQTGDGWTLYTNENGTKTYFGVKWNGNTDAKNSAVITLNTTELTERSDIRATFTLPRYWNIDIGANTLSTPVDVTFTYRQAEKDKVIADAATYANANSETLTAMFGNATPTDFTWFKTTGVAYNPTVHLNAAGIGGNPIKLTSSEADVNGIKQVTFTGITSFSGGTGAVGVGSESALPVTLLSFSGRPVENHISLSWKTASELNASGFEIERSLNAKSFEKIGHLSALGTSREILTYEFSDLLPKPGLNYYRLKQLDLDGTFAYSKIIPVTWEGSNEVTLYPNPATEQIELKLPKSTVISEIVIMNESGKVFKSMKQTEKTISVRGLTSGLYLLKIVTSDQVYTQKFIKIEE